MTPQRVGSYRIVRQIGRGGMGLVFEAVHESIGQRAAVKVLLPEFARDPQVVQRFFNEARSVSMVSHPGLVKINDFGTLPDGTVFILMEYLEGESLHQRLRRLGGRVPVPDAIRIARQMASALEATHGKGIVHRDLKPANVILIYDPEAVGRERAKILDFGLAKMRAAADPAMKTSTDMIMGTPAYMSPEQCRSAASAEERSDVYSLGVILYEMLAGRPPFVGQSATDLLIKHVTEEPPYLGTLLPGASAGLISLVHTMLAKAPVGRPDMGQVVLVLEGLHVERERSGLHMAPTRAMVPLPLSPPPAASTLSKSTGQISRLPLPARTRVLLALASLILLTASATFWLRGGKSEHDREQRVLSPPQRSCTLTSLPTQAQVLRADDHVFLGTTPFRALPPQRLVVRQRDHAEELVVMDGKGACDQLVTLRPLSAPPPRSADPGATVPPGKLPRIKRPSPPEVRPSSKSDLKDVFGTEGARQPPRRERPPAAKDGAAGSQHEIPIQNPFQ